MQPAQLILAAIAAAGVMLLVVGLASSRGRGAIDDRLKRYIPETEETQRARAPQQNLGERIAGSRTLGVVNRVVEQKDFAARLARDLARADVHLKVSEYLLVWAITIVAVPGAFLVFSFLLPTLRSPVGLMAGGLLGAIGPNIWLNRRKRSRLAAFDADLPDTITLLANGIRSGSSFVQATERVVRESKPPISTEFGRLIREIQLGLPFETALANMVRRVKSEDLEIMAIAVDLNRQFGGNVAEILDAIAATIRERVRIKGQIRTLTAQQRLSGYVVGFLPIGLAGFLFVAAPRFMAPMFEKPPELIGLPAGLVILGFGALMMAIGFSFIRKIVDIDV